MSEYSDWIWLPDDFIAVKFLLVGSLIRVEMRGKGTWAIYDGGSVWNGTEWEPEPLPSSRTDEFLKRTRFNRDDAFREARLAARATG